jgi:MFS family permease
VAIERIVTAVASLNVAIPSVARDIHATQTQLSWVIDAYALVFAALLLPGGAIGDRYGRRRALLAGLAIFGAGSAAAMVASDPGWLIAMRAVLGMGAALVMPATLSTITSTFPAEQKARAVGTWAGVAGASAILGLLASGVLLQAWSWRAVFGLNVVLAGTLSINLQFFAFFGFVFIVLQYLQLVRGDSPLVAALCLIPMALAMMPNARIVAPRLAAHVGTRRVTVLGLVLLTVGLVVLSVLDGDSSYWLLPSGLLPLGAGMALAMTPATAAVTDALPSAKQGIGSAMNDLARELGGALGIAVLGSVLQSTYRNHLQLPGLPAPVAEQARSSLALARQLGPDVAHRASAAFTDGMRSALITGAVAVALATVAVAALLRKGIPNDRATLAPEVPRTRA